jgi:HD superfamily phosphohydrolase YqeK
MAGNLQDAISEVVERARKNRGVLRVADAAVKLANQYGGDCREIASAITRAGLLSRVNMEISTPDRADAAGR